MFKHVNIPGIIILVIILAVIHFGVGLFISPVLKTAIVKAINVKSGSKIEVENAHIWPLTFSVALKGVKVYDPKRNEKIVEVGKASIRMSFWALLSKRIVLTSVNVSDASVYVKREPDGSLNIQSLGESKEAPKEAPSMLDRFKKKQDWFSLIYNIVKNRSSKKAVKKAQEEVKEAKKVKREVTELPRGKLVKFKTLRDDYLFEIRSLSMKNTSVHLESEQKEKVDIEKAGIKIRGLAMDPKKGAAFDALSATGTLSKAGKRQGSFNLSYARTIGKDKIKTEFDIAAKNVNMTAIDFIYKDSIPVVVNRGTISLNSKSDIVNGKIDSRNSLTLRNQNLAPKNPNQLTMGFVPMSTLTEAMNKVDPMNLKFTITGTMDSPQFGGFEDSLKELIKPYIQDIAQKGIKDIGKMLEKEITGKTTEGTGKEDTTQKAIDSIKSIFGK